MKMLHPDTATLVVIMKSTFAPLSPEEQQLLATWIKASPENQSKYEELTNSDLLHRKMEQFSQRNADKDLHFQYILQQVAPPPAAYRLLMYKKWSLAAAILLLLSVSGWLATLHLHNTRTATAKLPLPPPAVVVPGKPGALLMLSDGTTLVLDSLRPGVIAHQQGVAAALENGQLAYRSEGTSSEPVFNTLRTPKGREFKILLPDGTAAWLNSFSSIRFPTSFAADRREVFITGEVYFEVAAQTHPITSHKLPFVVHVKTADGHFSSVEVLGTHFNVNAYTAIAETTLLEGSVRISQTLTSTPVVLQPGQQAQVVPGATQISTATVDLDRVMAWRRGFFNFDNASLPAVMDQLARWYDLEPVYPQGTPIIHFQGEMSRGMQLSGVLQALEESKVHFKLDGRRISILP
ncbi:FecR domain-containing protein [Paraflavitalea pollutisoli]|uniref:FecR domain-containing protein n=1 Tax=Paraflavitalea pollutisoli TaxID=3034143 RepID=UPI0023ED1E17|nr:FecR domain-containing protein [Paraflavitalea sp. H1-2-19X]